MDANMEKLLDSAIKRFCHGDAIVVNSDDEKQQNVKRVDKKKTNKDSSSDENSSDDEKGNSSVENSSDDEKGNSSDEKDQQEAEIPKFRTPITLNKKTNRISAFEAKHKVGRMEKLPVKSDSRKSGDEPKSCTLFARIAQARLAAMAKAEEEKRKHDKEKKEKDHSILHAGVAALVKNGAVKISGSRSSREPSLEVTKKGIWSVLEEKEEGEKHARNKKEHEKKGKGHSILHAGVAALVKNGAVKISGSKSSRGSSLEVIKKGIWSVLDEKEVGKKHARDEEHEEPQQKKRDLNAISDSDLDEEEEHEEPQQKKRDLNAISDSDLGRFFRELLSKK